MQTLQVGLDGIPLQQRRIAGGQDVHTGPRERKGFDGEGGFHG